MKTLKVIDGAVELHGEVIDVAYGHGCYLAIDYLPVTSGSINEVYLYDTEPKFSLNQRGVGQWDDDTGALWHLIDLTDLTLEQCKDELYKLEF